MIQIFAPASEHGTAGVEELQQQTISLLSFKSLPRAVFDAQLAFNLLARYGEEAPAALEDAELRIERHLATLLALPGEGEGAPMPSLRLIQAPVFHGYSFSAWVEFEANPGIEALESGLATGSIEVRGADFEAPTNVGQAGPGRASPWAPSRPTATMPMPAGSGWWPTTSGWPPKTPWPWRGKSYEDSCSCALALAGRRLRLSRGRPRRPDAQGRQDHRHSRFRQRHHAIPPGAPAARRHDARVHLAHALHHRGGPPQADAVLTGTLANFGSYRTTSDPSHRPRHQRRKWWSPCISP